MSTLDPWPNSDSVAANPWSGCFSADVDCTLLTASTFMPRAECDKSGVIKYYSGFYLTVNKFGAIRFCETPPFVFIFLRIPFPATPFLPPRSESSGCGLTLPQRIGTILQMACFLSHSCNPRIFRQLRTLLLNGATASLLFSTASALFLSLRGWYPPAWANTSTSTSTSTTTRPRPQHIAEIPELRAFEPRPGHAAKRANIPPQC
jgi:hypothetical protein